MVDYAIKVEYTIGMRLTNSLPNTIQHWAKSSIGALTSGFSGLLNSSQQHQQASKDLMDGAFSDSGIGRQSTSGTVGVTVQISDAYRTLESEKGTALPSAESSVASINEAGITYSASARLVKASSAMIDALFDAVA